MQNYDKQFKPTVKKVFLSAAVIAAFLLYGVHQRQEESQAQIIIPTPTATPITDEVTPLPTTTPVATATPIGGATPKPTPTATPRSTGKYKDGSYTGSVADALWGNIQVRAVISGGRITSVQFLQYPNDRQHSVELNQEVMPILQQEAISAQSANVDIVSGASDSSQAFRESLAAALSQAS